jgi:hypothetical protein
MVEVRLELHLGAACEAALPAAEQVVSRHADLVELDRTEESAMLGVPLVCIALNGEAIRPALEVRAEPDLRAAPGVEQRVAAGALRAVDLRVFGVHAQRGIADRGSVPERRARLQAPAARREQRALRIRSRARDDVDDAVDGIRTPECGARTADHLDALDVLQHHHLLVPEDTREQRRVHGAAVDEHE